MKTLIVIADDHPIVLAGIRDLIDRDPGLVVVGQAQTPLALVELTRTLAPDIIITDYNMPGDDSQGDGIKLISYLRRHFPEVQVVVLTMLSNPSIIAEMYRAGAAGVVRKSGDLKELIVAVRAVRAHRLYRSPELPVEQALPDAGEASASTTLSPREFEVIRMFANGLTVNEIAVQLNRSSKTVSTQKVSAMRKLGTKSDQDLISYCLESDLFR